MRGGTPEFRTWIQSSSGRGSRDHRDVDPEIIRTRIQYLRTSALCGIRGPKVPVMVWDSFFPSFFFLFLFFFPQYIFLLRICDWLLKYIN